MAEATVTNDVGSSLLTPTPSPCAVEGHAPPRENPENPRRRRPEADDDDSSPDVFEAPDHELDRLA